MLIFPKPLEAPLIWHLKSGNLVTIGRRNPSNQLLQDIQLLLEEFLHH
jgi:hypothetical protein